jgi:hypothetical protein
VTVVFDSLSETGASVPITISSGTSSGSNFFDTLEGDQVQSATIISRSPASFGSQIYNSAGIQNTGTC